MEISLYDQHGTPVAYLDDNDGFTIWTWDGEAVAYLQGNAIYGGMGIIWVGSLMASSMT